MVCAQINLGSRNLHVSSVASVVSDSFVTLKNSPIQGSSAYIIKIAMINVDKKLKEGGTGARLLLQVHDELLIESPRECADEILALLQSEMENAVKLSVPLKVEAKSGDTWFDCH